MHVCVGNIYTHLSILLWYLSYSENSTLSFILYVYPFNSIIQKYQETFGEELGKVSFEKSGKPVIDNGYISLSHSNGVVAVCFSKTTLTAIDIELVKETLPKNTAEFIGVNNSPDFYKKWTQRECVIKAKNYSALKKGVESEFIGFSTEFLVEKKAFYLSVYGKNAEFIKV